MANKNKGNSTTESTNTLTVFSFVKDAVSHFIDKSKLNEAGLAAFKIQQESSDKELVALETVMSFPVPEGGFEQYLQPEFLAAYEAECKKWASEKDPKGLVEMGITHNFIRNVRISVNRSLLTPKADALYMTSAEAKKAAKKATVKDEPKAGVVEI